MLQLYHCQLIKDAYRAPVGVVVAVVCCYDGVEADMMNPLPMVGKG